MHIFGKIMKFVTGLIDSEKLNDDHDSKYNVYSYQQLSEHEAFMLEKILTKQIN